MDLEQQGEEFIRLYNELDHAVKQVTEAKGSVPFWKRLRMAARSEPSIKRHLDELLEFHELRNAIVHHRSYPDRLLAVPTQQTLDEFRSIVSEITSPELVTPRFSREIHVFSPTTPLHEALSYMKNHGFRQIVARLDGELKLVTPNGITNWLLSQVNNGGLDLRSVNLGEMLGHEEDDACRFIARNDSIDQAREQFEKASRKSPRKLFALLITEHGKPDELPLGIITPRDLL